MEFHGRVIICTRGGWSSIGTAVGDHKTRVDLKLRTRWEPASVTTPEGDSEKVETKIERRGSMKVFQLTAEKEGVGTRGEQGNRMDKGDGQRCGGIATHIAGAQ